MKKIISHEGTISGKTLLFRCFLLFVIYALLLFIVMPNDFWDIESKEVYNMRYFIREDRYLDLLKYSILTIPFWYLTIITITKRLGAFESTKNRWFNPSGWYNNDNLVGKLLVLPIIFSEGLVISESLLTLFNWIYFFWAVIFLIIPSLINSPITDYKNHKG